MNAYSNPEIFYQAVLNIKDGGECRQFFEELFTDKEIEMFAQRIAIAKLLDAGRNYADITQTTGASAATVSRVKRAVNSKKKSEQNSTKDFNSTVLKVITEKE
ncbi:MAG: TrpR YerC/YecD [Oscillospiraceae bacterium]|jgi:TrpR-related protein YerC/YecD|nr:TrpR YerC/YecD [Oscillospiraceae bacterium]